MRLFVALDIETEIRQRIAAFRNQMQELAPDVRWVGPETFHVTLQFLGETKQAEGDSEWAGAGEGLADYACISRRWLLPCTASATGFLGRH